MKALERIKQSVDDEDIGKDIEYLQRQIEQLPDRIDEKKLLKKRSRDNFKK